MNPLLQFLEPNYYTIVLPSKGIPYKIMNNLDKIFKPGTISEKGEIELRPLTTKDELIWTDPKLVESMRAPAIIAKNIVKGLEQPDLLARTDLETILLWARIYTYGKFTKVRWTCEECDHTNEITKDYTSLPINELSGESELTLDLNENFEITMSPLIFREAVEIQKANEDNNVAEQLDKLISCIDRVIIKSLPDDSKDKIQTDKRHISEWVGALDPKSFKKVLDFFTKVNEIGTVMELDVTCSNCGHKSKTEVLVDITNFFSEEG